MWYRKTLTYKIKMWFFHLTFKDIKQVNRKFLEEFNIQINEKMKDYLGEELLEILTPNFTTTDYDSTIIFKITIMGTFQNYFDYIF